MAMFATVDELADYLQVDFEPEDRVRAHRLLETASGIIQRAARQVFEQVLNDSVILTPTGTDLLMLPELPVTDVHSVTVQGTAMDAGQYLWTASGLLYASTLNAVWSKQTTVVYDHGFTIIPDDIVAITIALAGRAWQNPRGVLSEQIGTYSARYPNDRSGLILLPDEKHLVMSYRPRPG